MNRQSAFVGWVSSLSRLSGVTHLGGRGNPPSPQRVLSLGGLRAAPLSRLAFRVVPSGANPPYVSSANARGRGFSRDSFWRLLNVAAKTQRRPVPLWTRAIQ